MEDVFTISKPLYQIILMLKTSCEHITFPEFILVMWS